MATILDYVNIAAAVYHTTNGIAPDGNTVPGWSCKLWETGTWYGNGFQGGVYQNDREVICGFKGTNLEGPSVLADATADLRIGVGVVPNQAGGAYRMCRSAARIAAGRPISVCGHSLGGALAQVVAVWCDLPFVTFNAPGMRDHLSLSRYNFMKPVQMGRTWNAKKSDQIQGWNFRIRNDPVSRFGHHVGVEVEFPSVGSLGAAHKVRACADAVSASNYATMDAGWYF